MPVSYKYPPSLVLNHKETRQAGRCYTVTTWEVRSRLPLPRVVFDDLRKAGFLGYGQGFSVSPATEVTEAVPAVLHDVAGRLLAEGADAINAGWPEAEARDVTRTVYVYTVTDECDSGD